jgi:hypothetical protein
MGKMRAMAKWLALALVVSAWPLQSHAFFCFSFGGGSGPRAAPPPPMYGMPPGPPFFAPPFFAPPPVTSYTAPPGPSTSGVTISAPVAPYGSPVRVTPSVWEGLQDQDATDSGATF